jgi:hypothetical protein
VEDGSEQSVWFITYCYAGQDVCKLAFELTDGLSLVHLRCFFGWAATPAVFQVFTRLLQYVTNKAITGEGLLYVDDSCGCSPLVTSQQDLDMTRAK